MIDLKHEIIWKPLSIPSYRLVQNFDRHVVEAGEIMTQHDPLFAKEENTLFGLECEGVSFHAVRSPAFKAQGCRLPFLFAQGESVTLISLGTKAPLASWNVTPRAVKPFSSLTSTAQNVVFPTRTRLLGASGSLLLN